MLRKVTYIQKANGKPLLERSIVSARMVICLWSVILSLNYYWVDDDGVYMSQYDTTTPDRKYRVVENYKTENAYQGYSGYVFSH